MGLRNVQSLCWIVFAVCLHLQTARGHYYGWEIGSFSVEEATEGGAKGTVYAVNKSCIFIKGFSFDGNRQDRDARFSVGRSPQPDDYGVLIPDETGSSKSLGTYFQRDVLLNLPLDVEITKISWIAVWDLLEEVHYGYINTSYTLKPPERKHHGAFIVARLAYYLHINDIIIDNIKQITFVNVDYAGLKADSSVWIGNGGVVSPDWTQELFHLDRDLKFSSEQPLNITVTLPGNLTVDNLDSIRIWTDDDEDQVFGHFIISDGDKENLPPYLPNFMEMKHCEILLDEVYRVSWQLDEFNSKITLELSGRITLNEYMAFGISGSDNRMVGSDVIVVWIDPTTKEPQAEDYHLSDNSKCIGNIGTDLCPDISVPGGTNDVQLKGAVIKDGITTIEVSRPLTSDDPLDNSIQTDRPVLTLWSLGLRFKTSWISHPQLYTSGTREINFGTSKVSDCADLEPSVEEEKKGRSASKLFPALSDNIVEKVSSFTGRHISKRNAGSPDPVADLVTNACCFSNCQNGGIGFATVNQQLQCVCPFPWTGPDCEMTTTPCNPDPCQNGGTCSVVSGTTFRCDCTADFTGTICGLVDGGPFQVLCPSNVHLLTIAGNSQPVSATWQEPDAPGYQLIMRSHTPGDSFSVGETIVDYTFGTSQGIQTCTFCVTVQEVTVSQPTLDNCLDVTSSSSSQDGMNVTFTEPTAPDSCGPFSLLLATDRSGDFFPLGSTPVLFFFENSCGGLSSCTFTVTVSEDTTPPAFDFCPNDVVLNNIPAAAEGFIIPVSWTEPTYDDEGGTVMASQTHSPGDPFTIGEDTIVIYTIVDAAGNAATCDFFVRLLVDGQSPVDTTPPTCVNLPVGVVEIVELGVTGTTVSWEEPRCDDLSGTATVAMRSHLPGSFFLVGMTVVTYTCTDGSLNSAVCSFTVTVSTVDTLAPIISVCPDDQSISVELGETSGIAFWVEPIATDLSGTATLQSRSSSPGDSFNLGTNVVTYIFSDASNNVATCTFSVTVTPVDTIAPIISGCPMPGSVTSVVELGITQALVQWPEPTASDLSGVTTVIQRSHQPGSEFSLGDTTVTYVFSDIAGNTAECRFTVTVTTLDTTPPTISSCPNDAFATTELGSAVGQVVWIEPIASDISGVAILRERTAAPGDLFPVGQSAVTYTFVDASNNEAVCRFIVIVTEAHTIDLVISDCPGTISETVELGTSGSAIGWMEPSATDISGQAILVSRSRDPGSFFLVGDTSVVYTFRDPSGNEAVCDFIVMVNIIDTVPPRIANCPDIDIPVTIEFGDTSGVAVWPPITATDLSGVANLNRQTATPGDRFNLGRTTVIYDFVDASGNVATCSFVVAVGTGTAPCPERAVVEISSGVFTSVQLPEPLTGPQTTFIDTNGDPVSQDNFMVGITTAVRRNDESLCLQNIIIIDASPPEVTSCSEDIIQELKLGEKNTSVDWKEPSATDVEGGTVTMVSTHKPGDLFTKGATTVRYTFCDSSNNLATCTFTVIVTESKEDEPAVDDVPVIKNCYNNSQIVEVEEGQREHNVTLQLPPITDLMSSSPVKEENFTVILGFNELHYNYTDDNGNRETCLLQILVATTNATQKRGVFDDCPRTIIVNTTSITNFSEVFWTEPVAPSPAMVNRSPLPDDTFLEEITVTYTAEVNGIVTDKCSFIVNIADVTPPVVFNCPSEVNATSCRGAKTVHWYEPYAVDNSNKPVHVFQTHEPLKTPFKIGTTRVTYIFEDDSENIASCHFNVNVRKSQNCRPISPCWLLIIILILIVVVIVLLLICAVCLSCDKDRKDDDTQDDQEVEEMELS